MIRFSQQLQQLLQRTLKNWLPQSCFLCGTTTQQAICEQCLPHLNWFTGGCLRCAGYLPPGASSGLCGECLKNPPSFNRCYALFNYDYPLDSAIKAAKYQTNFAILYFLGELMASHLSPDSTPDGLIAVPMHPSDLRQRGYNQALVLAQILAQRLHYPLALNACVCTRRKQPQAQLSYRARRHNVRGLFQVHALPTHWQHVVIIDDVVTTGATVRELSRILQRSGVQQIDVWCCARRH